MTATKTKSPAERAQTEKEIKDMKKQELEILVGSIKHWSTEKIEHTLDIINDWETNHDKCKASYFWAPPMKAADRRRHEEYYTRTESVQIKDVKITYDSKCECSCRHYYWSDGLTVVGLGDEVKITFGDLRKLCDRCKDIITGRETPLDPNTFINIE